MYYNSWNIRKATSHCFLDCSSDQGTIIKAKWPLSSKCPSSYSTLNTSIASRILIITGEGESSPWCGVSGVIDAHWGKPSCDTGNRLLLCYLLNDWSHGYRRSRAFIIGGSRSADGLRPINLCWGSLPWIWKLTGLRPAAMSAQVILTVFVMNEDDCIARQSLAQDETQRRMRNRAGYEQVIASLDQNNLSLRPCRIVVASMKSRKSLWKKTHNLSMTRD